MTTLVHNLGLSKTLAFHDVYSIDDVDLLAFVPRPAHALLLVFPVNAVYEEGRRKEDGGKEEHEGFGDDEPVIWFKQTIRNACGLIGLLHAVANGKASELIGEWPRLILLDQFSSRGICFEGLPLSVIAC